MSPEKQIIFGFSFTVGTIFFGLLIDHFFTSRKPKRPKYLTEEELAALSKIFTPPPRVARSIFPLVAGEDIKAGAMVWQDADHKVYNCKVTPADDISDVPSFV